MHLQGEKWFVVGAMVTVMAEKLYPQCAKEYGSSLPPTISADDSREDVKKKMEEKFLDSVLLGDGEIVQDRYDFQNLDFELRFEKNSGKMTSWMLLVKSDKKSA